MALKQGLQIRQGQRLSLTPELRQSLDVLGLSSADLADLLAEEALENPCLIVEYTPSAGSAVDFTDLMENTAAERSLGAQLEEQIDLMRAPEPVRELARYIAWNLTEDGYLEEDEAALAAQTGMGTDKVSAALALVQACEPAGVGARSVAECVALQLAARGESPENLSLVRNEFPKLAGRDWRSLARPAGPTNATLEELRRRIRATSPRPAANISGQNSPTLGPDILVTGGTSERLVAALAPHAAPVLKIDRSLREVTTEATIRERLNSLSERAQSLSVAVRRRGETLSRIAGEIVLRQHAFFSHGPEALAPLTQAEVAAELGLHPSTVSRAVSGKYLGCRYGLFALSTFFGAALTDAREGVDISAAAVRHRLAKMIRNEPKGRAYSDETLARMLRETGVDISRRTVAKYRQCLKIPPSSTRRRSKNFL